MLVLVLALVLLRRLLVLLLRLVPALLELIRGRHVSPRSRPPGIVGALRPLANRDHAPPPLRSARHVVGAALNPEPDSHFLVHVTLARRELKML